MKIIIIYIEVVGTCPTGGADGSPKASVGSLAGGLRLQQETDSYTRQREFGIEFI